jgi:hypothetical protein
MIDREKLQLAFAYAILPYAQETALEDSVDDPLNDPFVIETAAFLTQEVIDSNLNITDELADLDDDELEDQPITQLVAPHLQELLSSDDPLAIISTTIQLYTAPPPGPETHQHLRNGPCEVLLMTILTNSCAIGSFH